MFAALLAISFGAGAIFGADVRDLGVPAGLRASDYDKQGYNLLNKGQYESAIRYFDAAIRTDPNSWSAYFNRAAAFCQQKKWPAALQDLNSVIRLRPAFFTASFLRAAVNVHLGNYQASLADLDNLSRLGISVRNQYTEAQALNGSAWLRATCINPSVRNAQRAIRDAAKACKLTEWKISGSIDTLAAAYAEAGDFDSAARYEQQAITTAEKEPAETSKVASELFGKRGVGELVNQIAKDLALAKQDYLKRLDLYKQRRPYREAAPQREVLGRGYG